MKFTEGIDKLNNGDKAVVCRPDGKMYRMVEVQRVFKTMIRLRSMWPWNRFDRKTGESLRTDIADGTIHRGEWFLRLATAEDDKVVRQAFLADELEQMCDPQYGDGLIQELTLEDLEKVYEVIMPYKQKRDGHE